MKIDYGESLFAPLTRSTDDRLAAGDQCFRPGFATTASRILADAPRSDCFSYV